MFFLAFSLILATRWPPSASAHQESRASVNQLHCSMLEKIGEVLAYNWLIFPPGRITGGRAMNAQTFQLFNTANQALEQQWRTALGMNSTDPLRTAPHLSGHVFRAEDCAPISVGDLEDLYRNCFWDAFKLRYDRLDIEAAGWGQLPRLPDAIPGVSLSPQLLRNHLGALGQLLAESGASLRHQQTMLRHGYMANSTARFANADRLLLDVWYFLNRPRHGEPCRQQRHAEVAGFARTILRTPLSLPLVQIHESDDERVARACTSGEIADASDHYLAALWNGSFHYPSFNDASAWETYATRGSLDQALSVFGLSRLRQALVFGGIASPLAPVIPLAPRIAAATASTSATTQRAAVTALVAGGAATLASAPGRAHADPFSQAMPVGWNGDRLLILAHESICIVPHETFCTQIARHSNPYPQDPLCPTR